jgi:hypothetical protein
MLGGGVLGFGLAQPKHKKNAKRNTLKKFIP